MFAELSFTIWKTHTVLLSRCEKHNPDVLTVMRAVFSELTLVLLNLDWWREGSARGGDTTVNTLVTVTAKTKRCEIL